MDGDLDARMQRILSNAGAFNGQEELREIYNFSTSEPRTTEWNYASAPRLMQDSRQYGGFAPTSFEQASTTFQAINAHSGPAGASLGPPRNLYTQQEREPRTINNVEHHFRTREDLNPSAPFSQPGPRAGPTSHAGDTIGQLASAMLSYQPMSFRKQESSEQVTPFQGLPTSRLTQLQPQKQQITPPFNLSGYTYTPPKLLSADMSSPITGQNSSPPARVSLRRETSRIAPPSHHPNVKSYSQDEKFKIQTPQRQTAWQERTPQALALNHAPPMAQGIQLISPHELPDRFRQIFPYQLFNAPQSKCFGSVYRTNDNVVVSAPTGSGKTAILELAICKLVEGHRSGQFKIVYQAPTKSLCSERMRDWTKKFAHLNLTCAELTGDTTQAEMTRVRTASILVTTPEKWDSITRKWTDHQKLVQMVKLFLIDEVHILKDARGATLEAVVSRMKTMGADVRFVALSATVPNSADIAVWLGRDHTNQHLPARRETFGEDFRPVKLQKHVHGFEGMMNDFAFEKILDGKLPSLIAKYTHKKPIMIFCFTRKSCENTAASLAEWWTRQRSLDRAWPTPLQRTVVGSRDLQQLVGCGVAFHHAGLDPQDRQAIETGYLKGDISVICCTSTLAVGVNLPCHMVVLKGTVGFQDGLLTECSDLEVMQMLGRAGRPQFDDNAIAIIMTRSDKADRYQKMISGQDVLESTLHLNLIEHLNSEVSLGTIKDSYTAKKWLAGTFLSVRMRQNPQYYKIADISPGFDTDRRLEQICERDINLLQEQRLISSGERFTCTEYGEAMSRYMVQFETMKLLLSIPKGAKTEQILHIICQAAEFKDLRMKPQERPFLREFNKSPFIKFPIKENVSTTPHKISLMLQVQLGGVDLPNEKDFTPVRRQFTTEKTLIFERIQRLIRCVIDCKAADNDAVATRHSLDLARSLSAEYWEYSNLQLRQIPNIGPVAARKLVSQNISTVENLAATDTATIERYMSKNPPYGKKLKDTLQSFPRLHLTTEIAGKSPFRHGQKPKIHITARLSFENEKTAVWRGRKPSVTFMAETTEGALVHFWRGNVTALEKGYELKFAVELSVLEEEIKCWVACEEIVGTMKSCVLQHDIPASSFPLPLPVKVNASPVKEKKKKVFDDTDDEFGGDGLEDEELIAAASNIEKGKNFVEKGKAVEKSSNDYGSGDFADVDDFDTKPTTSTTEPDIKKPKPTREPLPFLEPYLMANGKWTCLHACRDEGTLKSGQKCKHLCCREGHDKAPKRPKARKSSNIEEKIPQNEGSSSNRKPQKSKSVKPKLEFPGMSDEEVDEVEIVDLAMELPPTGYDDIAPREYRKLQLLHSSIQKDRDKPSLRLLKTEPNFSYGTGAKASLEFMNPNVYGDDEIDDEDFDFPDPGQMTVGRSPPAPQYCHEEEEETQTADPEHNPYADCSFEFEDQTYNSPEESNIDEAKERTGSQLEIMNSTMSSLLRPNSSKKQRVASPAPKVNSSFAHSVFNFDDFTEVDAIGKELDRGHSFLSPVIKSAPGQAAKMTQSSSVKREHSPSLEPSPGEVKCRRLTREEVDSTSRAIAIRDEPVLPEWTNEIDKNLLDELIGVVDFV